VDVVTALDVVGVKAGIVVVVDVFGLAIDWVVWAVVVVRVKTGIVVVVVVVVVVGWAVDRVLTVDDVVLIAVAVIVK
jgi:hypothetical protein